MPTNQSNLLEPAQQLNAIKAAHLNPEQKKAILTTEGKVLILAGAGSGKTSVLTYRMAHLIDNLSVEPSSVLGLTFTNKAAEEMRHRVAKVISSGKAKKIVLCTFHSFCMQVLRQEIERLGYTRNFSLYDEGDMKRVVTQLSHNILEHETELPSMSKTLSVIRDGKAKGLNSEDLSIEGSNWHQNFTKTLYNDLEMCLRAYNAVDFDSLISLTVKLFEEHPDILKRYQDRFNYIMIDEYQDTNQLQYKLAKLLSSGCGNLCVVGDDDQSIYGWRGAEVSHILKFEYDTLIKLEQNYRSTQKILDAANGVISHNTERHPKVLWSNKKLDIPIYVFHAPTDKEEAEAVITRILHFKHEHHFKWKDFAILYRSNILARAFEMALLNAQWKDHDGWKRGIPYQVFGGVEFFERSEIKDLIAYLKLISNPKDQEALLRVINFPRRGISEKALDLLTQLNRKKKIPLWNILECIAEDDNDYQEIIHELSKHAVQGIIDLVHLIQEAFVHFEENPLHESLEWLVETIHYKMAISDDVKSEKMQNFKWENVKECILNLKTYEETTEAPSLGHFLSTTSLDSSSIKRVSFEEEDKVNLMTFHSSKGLEFPVCFLIGLEDHIIPHEKSLLETGIEEERRLMYVALTRCKQHLYLSMAKARLKHGKEIRSNPSRFLFEIPSQLIKPSSWKFVEMEDSKDFS